MSYETLAGGARSFGGFGYQSLSGTFPVGDVDEGIREVQHELQRLGYMPSGDSLYGADGRFGPRTAASLRSAARYVGWTDAPYSPSNAAEMRSGDVEIPDDLITRLKSAAPNPNAPHGGRGAPAPTPPSDSPSSDAAALLTQSEGREGGTGWVPAAIIGAGVLAAGGWFIYAQRKKKPKRNRRRRRRTSRR